ncbi:MAG TPA: virulence protein RhuM/Fic/DOC family protein [bacterium]|jgi:death-on-curing family protein|nr:virulence protein RhuM/Fic/DOC family protein [bacterium]HPD55462.1 virulence protein RhuM/Fic/DOC family protein [Candidatus Paceibacterota bacterium]HPL83507.1 virulence protein RhuM/Fic/DOC family protein [bacterium]HQG58700.1 virulence protein RhuM/Fic/DOC family protein [bacterium]HQK58724.1 virulence protein RhuM/Fic/DOC family protein [Candidatus Pacearchaeota archaeon]
MKEQEIKKGEVIIYKSKEGPKLEVRLEENTVWLTQNQIALLFSTQRPAITKHLNNIFKSGELDKNSVSSILEHTANDGKTYKTQFYNLDAIISVGYRVNSNRATQFRIWATKTLKEHLVKGYTLNEKRLLQYQNSFQDLQETITLLQEKSKHELLVGQEQEILSLLSSYSKTLTLLEQYDKEKLKLTKKAKEKYVVQYDEARKLIDKIKKDLIAKNEASNLFGQENEDRFKAIIKNIYQTFDGKELYSSLEEKAAHILYLVIKDHPFVDGNKRIGSFLFIYYLNKNNYLYKENGEKKINDNTLTTLALLVAISVPKEKDKLIKIVTNLLAL